jgi:hypothetical protein
VRNQNTKYDSPIFSFAALSLVSSNKPLLFLNVHSNTGWHCLDRPKTTWQKLTEQISKYKAVIIPTADHDDDIISCFLQKMWKISSFNRKAPCSFCNICFLLQSFLRIIPASQLLKTSGGQSPSTTRLEE